MQIDTKKKDDESVLYLLQKEGDKKTGDKMVRVLQIQCEDDEIHHKRKQSNAYRNALINEKYVDEYDDSISGCDIDLSGLSVDAVAHQEKP